MGQVRRSSGSQGRAQRSRRSRLFNFRLVGTAMAVQGLLAMVPAGAQTAALPQGASVVHGQVSITASGTAMQVTTGTAASVINWQGFSVGRDHSVHFQQPSASSQVLNRVLGQDPSRILGSLSSNGQVWLINPNGVLFGQGARVDVAGLVASTLDITNGDFLAGRHHLRGAIDSQATVINQGDIRTPFGGRVFLVGQNVQNAGAISTPGGQTGLAAGHSVDLVDSATPYLTLRVESRDGQVINTGTVASGRIDVHGAVVRQDGSLQATELARDASGAIVLRASQTARLGTGSLTAAHGGSVQVQAPDIQVAGAIDVSGPSGGGSVNLGGTPWADGGARTVRVEQGAAINADATEEGKGGRIVLWSEDLTQVAGRLSARGGAQGGDGGFIETSAARQLDLQSTPDAGAPQGRAGEWLIDPYNLTIVAGAGSTNASGLTATGDNAQVGADLITSALNSGTSVTVSTGDPSGGTQSGDLTVAAAINTTTPTLGGAPTLTLNANRNISINAAITAGDAGGALNLALNANQGGGGGTAFATGQIRLNGGMLSTTSPTTFSGLTLSGTTVQGVGTGKVLLASGSTNTFTGVTLDSDVDLLSIGVAGSVINVTDTLTLGAGRTMRLRDSGSFFPVTMNFTGTGGAALLTGQGTLSLEGSSTVVRGTSAAAPLTIDTGVTVSGSGGTLGQAGAGLINRGTIRSAAGSLTVTGTDWVNEGVVRAEGGAIRLAGTYSAGAPGTIQVDSGSVSLSGTWNNAGNTYDIAAAGSRGNITFSGLTLLGGTVRSSGTGKLLLASGSTNTFSGVTLDTDVDLLSIGVAGSVINVTDTLTLGAGRTMRLRDSGSFFPVTMNFTGAGGTSLLTGQGTLSLEGSSTVVRGTSAAAPLTIDTGVTVSGSGGTLGLAGAGLINRGTIRSAAGSLTVTGTDWVNEGVVRAEGGTVNLTGTNWDNQGVIRSSAGTVNLTGAWTNSTGTLDAAAGTIRFNSAFDTTDLGQTIRSTGTFAVGSAGIWNNAGQSYDLAAAGNLGDVSLEAGSRLVGGTITSSDPAKPWRVAQSVTFDGVTIGPATDVVVTSTLNIQNGLRLDGGTVKLSAPFGADLQFNGTGEQSIEGSGSVLAGRYNSASSSGTANILAGTGATLRVGSGVTVRTVENSLNVSGLSSNEGVIRSDAGTFMTTLSGTNWVNRGLIQSGGGTLDLAGNWANTTGTLDAQAGTIAFRSAFDTADIGTTTRGATGLFEVSTGGVWNNAGQTYDLGAAGNLGQVDFENTGRLVGGTIVSSDPAEQLVVKSGGGATSPTFDGVTIGPATEVLVTSGTLNVENGLRLDGGTVKLRTPAGSSLQFSGSGEQSIEGSGSVLAGRFNSTVGGGTANIRTGTGATLRIGSGVTVRTVENSLNVSGLSSNEGVIRSDAGAVITTLGGTNWVNRGLIQAGGGTLDLTGNWANTTGTLDAQAGTIAFRSAFDTADIGTTTRGATGLFEVSTGGVWNNAGQTYDLGAAGNLGQVDFENTGRLVGGTIVSSDPAEQLVVKSGGGATSPTFDGVTIGPATEVMVTSGTLNVENGLRLDGGTVKLRTPAGSSLQFNGSGEQSIEGSGSVLAERFSSTIGGGTANIRTGTGATLRIGSGVTVRTVENSLNVSGLSSNEGVIRSDAGAAITTLSGTNWVNRGLIQADGGVVSLGTGFGGNAGVIDVAGATAQLLSSNADLLNLADGTVRGNGSVNLSYTVTVPGQPTQTLYRTLVNQGTVDPGTGAGGVGTLTINGNLTQAAGSRMNVDLAGTAAGQVDRLVVTQNAQLAGELRIQENGVVGGVASGFHADLGMSFPSMLTVNGTQTGAFTQLAQPADVSFTANLSGGLGITGTTQSVTRWGSDASGLWNTASLWTRGTPTAGKDAIIDRGAADTTVTLSGTDAVARSLQINEALAVDGRSLRIGGGDINGSVSLLSGGSLVTDAGLGGSGLLSWSSGTIGGNGSLGFLGGANFGFSGSGDRIIDNPNINFSFTNLDLPLGSLTLRNGGLTFNTTPTGSTRVGAGASLLVEGGRMTNNGPMQIAGFLGLYGGRLDGSGSFNVAGGTLDLPASSTLDWAATGAFVNTGTLQMAGRTITSPFSNAGTLIGGNGLTFSQAFTNTGSYTQSAGTVSFAGGFTQTAGSFQLGTAGTPANAQVGAGGMQFVGGEFRGAGTVQGNVQLGNAALRVGYSPGALNITGDLTLSAGSVTDIEVGGTGAGQFDTINVSGTASLAGTLNLLQFGGYTPVAGDTVAYLGHGASVGDFGTVNFVAPTNTWSLGRVLTATGQQLGATAVPPAAVAAPTVAASVDPALVAPSLQSLVATTENPPTSTVGDTTGSAITTAGTAETSLLEQVAMFQAQADGSVYGASSAIFDTTAAVASAASVAAVGGAVDTVPPHRYLFSDGEQQYFRVLPVADMAQGDMSGVLLSRKAYKKSLFAQALEQLKKDPALPDLPTCSGGQGALSGACIVAPGNASTEERVEEVFSRIASAAIPQIGRKVALMVGVNRYDDKRIPQLVNAQPDAAAVGQVLASQLGYEVIRLDNPTKAELIGTLNSLVNRARDSDSLVLYFAGHGELVESTGFGYWIPRDGNAQDARTWVSNADVNRLLALSKSRQIAVMADSCYSGSFAREASLSGQQATTRLDGYLSRRAVTVMTSGGDEPVADSGRNGHSVFAWNLMAQLRQLDGWQPGVSVFNAVQVAVERELPQTPLYGASLTAGHEDGADFLFERRQPGR